MDLYVYFVRFSVPLFILRPVWTYFRPACTVLTLDFPVRDHDDTVQLKGRLAEELFIIDGILVEPEEIRIENLTLLETGNTKAYDKYRLAKERANEDAERGYPEWWRGPKREFPNQDEAE